MMLRQRVALLSLCCLFLVAARDSAMQEDLNVRFATLFGAGTCSASTLNTIMTNSSSTGGLSDVTTTLVIPPYAKDSNTPCTWNLTTNVTTPATLEISIPRGAVLTPASGVTLTLGRCPQAGPYQIFNADGLTTGTVVFAATAHCAGGVYPEWWGAAGNGSGNDAKAINAASAAVTATGSELILLGKVYRTTETVLYGDNFKMRGQGRDISIIECTTGVCFGPRHTDQNYQYNRFADFGIQCEDTTEPYDCSTGFHYGAGRYGKLDNIFINRMADAGLLIDPQAAPGNIGSYYNEFSNFVIRGVTDACVRQVRGDNDDRPNGNIFTGGHWNNCATGGDFQDGSTGRLMFVAIEGVSTNFLSIGSSGFTIMGARMENSQNLPSGQGIVLGETGGGVQIFGGTIEGGHINLSNLKNLAAYCVMGTKVNGQIQSGDCPLWNMVGPRLLIGNPYGCFGPHENLLKRSEALDENAHWETDGTIIITQNGVIGPRGDMNAEILDFGNEAGATPTRSQVSAVVASNQTVYFGIWLKSTEYGSVQWRIEAEGLGGDPVHTGKFNVTDEWQYHLAIATFCETGTDGCTVEAADVVRVGLRRIVDGGDIDILHAWGAQLGLGDTPKCYVHTTDTVVSTTDQSLVKNQLNFSTQGAVAPSNAGAFTDALFTVDVNGLFGSDSTNGRWYWRHGGAWHYVAQTAGIQVRAEDAHDHLLGYHPNGSPIRPFEAGDVFVWIINGWAEDGAAHAEPVLLSTVLQQQLTDLGVAFQPRPIQRRLPQRTWQPSYFDELGKQWPDLVLGPDLKPRPEDIPPHHPLKRRGEGTPGGPRP